jgi:multiple sugar transport system permease protein
MSDTAHPAAFAPARTGRPRLARALPYLLSLPALLVCIGIIVPFVTAAWYSLQRYNLAMPFARGFIGVQTYIDFLGDPDFWNTVKVPAIASLMWKLMTNPGFGVLSWIVTQTLGLSDFKWASDPRTAMLTVVLVDIWVYTPFMMILLLAGLRSLPTQPFEAARLDGVPAHFVFLRITLPMLMPYIVTATLFRLLDAIQQFDIVYAMTQGGPGDSLMLFQVRAYLEFFQYTNVGTSAALMMILWAITYALSNVFVKQWLKLRERAHGAQ